MITRGISLTEHSQILWHLKIFLPLVPKYSVNLRCVRYSVDVSTRTGVYNSAFLLMVLFCNGLSLLKREVFLSFEKYKLSGFIRTNISSVGRDYDGFVKWLWVPCNIHDLISSG